MKEKKFIFLYGIIIILSFIIIGNFYRLHNLNIRIDEIEFDLEKIEEHVIPFYDQS